MIYKLISHTNSWPGTTQLESIMPTAHSTKQTSFCPYTVLYSPAPAQHLLILRSSFLRLTAFSLPSTRTLILSITNLTNHPVRAPRAPPPIQRLTPSPMYHVFRGSSVMAHARFIHSFYHIQSINQNFSKCCFRVEWKYCRLFSCLFLIHTPTCLCVRTWETYLEWVVQVINTPITGKQ